MSTTSPTILDETNHRQFSVLCCCYDADEGADLSDLAQRLRDEDDTLQFYANYMVRQRASESARAMVARGYLTEGSRRVLKRFKHRPDRYVTEAYWCITDAGRAYLESTDE